MAVSEEVANLCRLCMNPTTTSEMTNIFQEQENSSVFSMKIMTCFSVEVHKTDQLPKQMCPPCVYQLEKFYIFRKVCRKTDTKYRSFLRKLKSKKIQRLDELSDDDDDESSESAADTNIAFVQEYERKQAQQQVDAQLKVKLAKERTLIEEQVTAKLKSEFHKQTMAERSHFQEQVTADLKEKIGVSRKTLLQQVKMTLYQTIDSLVDPEEDSVEVYSISLEEHHIHEETPDKTKAPKVTVLNVEPVSTPPRRAAKRSVATVAAPPKKEPEPEPKPVEEEEEDDQQSDSESDEDEEDEDMQESGKGYNEPSDVIMGRLDDVLEEQEVEEEQVGEDFEGPLAKIPFYDKEAVIVKDGLIHSCNICSRKFSTREKLKKHANHHKTEKNVCDDCGKCFSSSGSLFRHKKIHTDEKAFKCDVCGKGFTQKGSLLRHVTIHQDQKPFPCDKCGKCFSQRNLLTDHVTKAHSDLAVTFLFPCTECPKSFRYSSGLSRHALTHSGKPFPCETCGRQLADYSSLQRHMRLVHKDKADE